jgi:methyl-accepting chemotaxis protein
MRYKLILSFLGVILWILTINFISSMFIEDPWKSQALSAACGLLVGMTFWISLSNSIAKNMTQLVKSTTIISEGDLSQDVQVKSDDEIGELANSFQKMLLDLRNIVLQVKKSSLGVKTTSDELYDSIKQMSSINDQVTLAVEKVADAAETQSNLLAKDSMTLKGTSASIRRIASMAKTASNSAARAVKDSHDGKNAAQSAINQIQSVFSQIEKSIILIQGLGNKINKISRILDIISDIARKTDLLSLNATVEASKAGEYGRGFGIVAEEIRNLTDESKASAKEITAMVEEIQAENLAVKNSIEEGVKGIKKGREMITMLINNFDRVVEEVTRLGGGFEEISIETQRQAMDSEKIAQAFEELNKLAQKNSLAMKETAAAMKNQKLILDKVKSSSQKLMNTANELNVAVEQFKVSNE